jgi:hypothetical protein
VLEEFKTNKNRRFELTDLVNHIVEFSADQHGSRHGGATCHAPTGRPATCHAPTGRHATCHTLTGRPALPSCLLITRPVYPPPWPGHLLRLMRQSSVGKKLTCVTTNFRNSLYCQMTRMNERLVTRSLTVRSQFSSAPEHTRRILLPGLATRS